MARTDPSTSPLRARMVSPEALTYSPAGPFPNNPELPVLLYREVATPSSTGDALARLWEQTFAANGWTGSWRDTIYAYRHYHSNAHEVLGCFAGRARLELAGVDGTELDLAAGDVLVLPAGTAHRRIETSDDFSVVGAYDRGIPYDVQRGEMSERSASERRIAETLRPEHDPLYGREGPLIRMWRRS